MAYPSVTHTFTNGAASDAGQVNQNFTDIINALSDGTKDVSVASLATAGNEAFTYDEGSFTAGITGLTTAPTATIYYVRVGKMVTLALTSAGLVGTSDGSANVSITGLPVGLRPARIITTESIPAVVDGGNNYTGFLSIQTSGTMYLNVRRSLTAYSTTVTGSGSTGVQAFTVTYPIH